VPSRGSQIVQGVEVRSRGRCPGDQDVSQRRRELRHQGERLILDASFGEGRMTERREAGNDDRPAIADQCLDGTERQDSFAPALQLADEQIKIPPRILELGACDRSLGLQAGERGTIDELVTDVVAIEVLADEEARTAVHARPADDGVALHTRHHADRRRAVRRDTGGNRDTARSHPSDPGAAAAARRS
jgi:hypothetical protein